MGFHYADYIIFVLFLAFSLSIGLYHAFRGGKQKTTEEFLMGDRKLQTFPVAISITLSFISAIVVLGQPAEVYTRGTQFSVVVLGQLCAIIFAIIFIAPIFFKLQVTSSFEYLELRYNSKAVKLTGSIVMLIFSTIQLGIVLYAPSVALEAVAGLPTWVSIMFSSIVAIIYTTLGGMKAVIWTDVFQGGCVLVGMMAVVIQGILRVGGTAEVWSRNELNGRIEFFNMDPNPTVRTTFWSAFINGAFIAFSAMGVGQTTVQRYCALPTLGKARWALMINVILLAIILILATVSGMVIFAYYDLAGCDPLKGKQVSNANQLLPHFVMDVLNYPGFPGLFISVLYGGALSTMSSSLNSAAAVTWQDILKKFFKHLDDSNKALVTKLLVVIFGGISIGMAFLTKFLGPHVLQAVSVVTGTVYGPLFGMFMMGMFFKCANAKGAIAGCLSGIALTSWVAIGSILTNQNNEILPTSTSSCSVNMSSLTTTNNFINNLTTQTDATELIFERTSLSFNESSEVDLYRSPLNVIYSLSYLLYSFLGFIVTVTVGLLVSLCTGGLKNTKIDPDLMANYDFFYKGFNCSDEVLNEIQLPLELVDFRKANDNRNQGSRTNSILNDHRRTFAMTTF